MPTPDKTVTIHLFWGDGCPHCAKAKPYIESLPAKYPGLVVKTYEIYYDQANQQRFTQMAEEYGLQQTGVPAIFIGPYVMLGYSEEMQPDIEALILRCFQENVSVPQPTQSDVPLEISPTAAISSQATPTLTPFVSPTPTGMPLLLTPAPTPPVLGVQSPHTLDIPWIGAVDLNLQSITFSTILIALVDGFNPCSLWVLSMLIALTLHTGSRKKVFLIGLIFLTVTAAIYILFIVGLFSVLKIASFLGWIQILVALVALSFALVNIKDYFWYKEGISFTISEDKKAGIFKRMRAVMDASQSFLGLTSATIVLAAGVSLVEFSCTAGFPVIWVNLLNAQHVSGAAFLILLLLYMVIYQLDEMVIFFSAIVSLRASRLEEKHGRILKLAGGMLMLTLSVVMLFNPAWMNSLGSSMIIFAIAFFATLLILFVHRFFLPKIGIHIGSEFS